MSEMLLEASEEYLVRYDEDFFPALFTSARGTVKDFKGREYLDFTSGQMCATIGHNHPAIVEAVQRAGEKAFHFFSGMIPEVVVELAQTLARDWRLRIFRRRAGHHDLEDTRRWAAARRGRHDGACEASSECTLFSLKRQQPVEVSAA